MSNAEINEHIRKCQMLPIEETVDGWNEAIDGIDAVLSTLGACQNDVSRKICKAAECALNRVDRIAENEILGPGDHVLVPEAIRILSRCIHDHPRYQDELKKQALQLEYLQQTENVTRDGVLGAA